MDVNGKKRCASGYTLLETVMAVMIFAVLASALYASTLAMQHFTTTAVTDIDLQEAARNALQKMMADLRQAGRCTVNGLAFPRFGNFCSPALGGVPAAFQAPSGAGYGVFKHPAPAVIYNNASFTAPSREIIFVAPDVTVANPPYLYNAAAGATVTWGTTQIAYIVQLDPASKLNRLERWVYDTSQGKITNQAPLATGVQRIVVDDWGQTDQYSLVNGSTGNANSPWAYSGPTLKQDQLVITLYCAGQPDYNSPQVVQTILSVSVNMRNTTNNSTTAN